jgi:hypothetical protein
MEGFVMLTKQEMEDIWHNKPIDYLKTLNKNMKGTKMYKVHLTPVKYDISETEAFEVRAKSKDDAVIAAKEEYYKKHGKIRPDAWRVNCYVK